MTRHKKHVLYTVGFLGVTLAIGSVAFINLGFYISRKRYNFNYLTNLNSYSRDPLQSDKINSQEDLDAFSLTLSKDDILFEMQYDMSVLFNSAVLPYFTTQWKAHFDDFHTRKRNGAMEFAFSLRINYVKSNDPISVMVDSATIAFDWTSFKYIPAVLQNVKDNEEPWVYSNYLTALSGTDDRATPIDKKGIVGYDVNKVTLNMHFSYENSWQKRNMEDWLFMYNNYCNSLVDPNSPVDIHGNQTQWWPTYFYFTSYFFQNIITTIPNA